MKIVLFGSSGVANEISFDNVRNEVEIILDEKTIYVSYKELKRAVLALEETEGE